MKAPIIAVDPGKSGAVIRFFPPTMELEVWRDFKNEHDLAVAIRDASEPWLDLSELKPVHAVVEAVHSMPGQGVVSTFTFGTWTGGAWIGLLALGLQVHRPTPQSWQKWIRTQHPLAGRTEFDSVEVARRIFPSYAETLFARKMDHNTADAVLMAYWFWRTMLN